MAKMELKTTGRVYLVGAGPGDPGLITVRGRELIGQADVVVYDNLAAPELLRYARAGAELIYVGKQAGRHALPQDQINQLLVNKAQAGALVVRLKGGDPYVFGRGGEEALDLVAAGVPFEVTPGVTAGVAVPAYAGIPVTHRDFASNLALITGHEDASRTETSQVDWEALGLWKGTLVFYMGVKNLPVIAERLVAHGMDPQTPAAVIHRGTTPHQQTVMAPLAQLPAAAVRAEIKPPALIVVGRVVALRDQLNWYERRPLFGRCVLVTRARAQASELVEQLTELGAEVLEFPTIRVEPLTESAELRQAVEGVGAYDWVIFTSVNGVEVFFEVLAAQGHDTRRLGGVQVAAVGAATAQRLAAQGVRPDLVPPKYVAESILEALTQRGDLTGRKVLLPRADIARSDLPEALAGLGAVVSDVVAYRTVAEQTPGADVAAALAAGRVDYVTFTSRSTFVHFLSHTDMEVLQRRVARIVSIGPMTTAIIEESGLRVDVQAEESTIPGLVEAICRAERAR